MTVYMELNRFVIAQKEYIKIAKTELKQGKKETHWIWFVFPQLKDLGTSEYSSFYGLDSLQDAKKYYRNAYLRRNLNSCFHIIHKYADKEELADSVGMLDAIKIRSCATLFYLATKQMVFKRFLNKFFDGFLDDKTVLLLSER